MFCIWDNCLATASRLSILSLNPEMLLAYHMSVLARLRLDLSTPGKGVLSTHSNEVPLSMLPRGEA
jgi:hypothetical protein